MKQIFILFYYQLLMKTYLPLALAAVLAGCATEPKTPTFQELLPCYKENCYKIQCETQVGATKYAVAEDSYGTPELVSFDGKDLKRNVRLFIGGAKNPWYLFYCVNRY